MIPARTACNAHGTHRIVSRNAARFLLCFCGIALVVSQAGLSPLHAQDTGAIKNADATRDSATAGYATETNVLYRSEDGLTPYAREQCRLDVYHPTAKSGFATVVWFHGGGLTGGKREVPKQLREKGFAVVAVSYRLYPKIKAPTYIEDAAAAVAWTIKNIKNYGGSADKVFVSGHSAGGYLTSMVGLDTRWLAKHDVDTNQLAGLIPFSGHTITHFTVRKERGIKNTRPIVDDMAPLYHVRKDAPPLLLITGDREKEMLGRYEENAYLARMMQVAGHTDTTLYELDGFDHGGMATPGHELLIDFVNRHSR